MDAQTNDAADYFPCIVAGVTIEGPPSVKAESRLCEVRRFGPSHPV